MALLRRKMDSFLRSWKEDPDRLPLIVKGARQIGKTSTILQFGKKNYESVVNVNFALMKGFRNVFGDGYEVDTIIKNISLLDGGMRFIPGKTLIFFDEIQACPDCATSLKSFALDGRYDVICSGSLMGISYAEIESNSVGYKKDKTMYSMDFEEFLWAKGYDEERIEGIYSRMRELLPYGELEKDVYMKLFREYMVTGGMPSIVASFVAQGNYQGILEKQTQVLLDYEEDITKYTLIPDRGKTLNAWRKIPVFLGKDNKKFMVSKIANGARHREYVGVMDWLEKSGMVNLAHNLVSLELPLKGNGDPENYKVYFSDTGLLVASLDEEAQRDLRENRNFNTYKGALYENVVAEEFMKQGLPRYFYRNEKGTMELDFVLRNRDSLIPVEVKAGDSRAKSLRNVIEDPSYPYVSCGMKFSDSNVGYSDGIYTFPLFTVFLLSRFLRDVDLSSRGR